MERLKETGRRLLRAWEGLGRWMNAVCSPLILGAVYFGLLTPVALLYRLCHRKPKGRDSTFVERRHSFSAKDFENPW